MYEERFTQLTRHSSTFGKKTLLSKTDVLFFPALLNFLPRLRGWNSLAVSHSLQNQRNDDYKLNHQVGRLQT